MYIIDLPITTTRLEYAIGMANSVAVVVPLLSEMWVT